MEGDDHREAYTTIVQGEQLSPEKYKPTEAEVLDIGRRQHVRHRYVRGAVALSWSKTLSCDAKDYAGTWEISCLAGWLMIAPVRVGRAHALADDERR